MADLAISKSDTVLVVVDIQDSLCRVLDQTWLDAVIRRIGTLALFAERENLPVVLTEQYPKGLGPTKAEVLDLFPKKDYAYFSKTSFGCADDAAFLAHCRQNFAGKKLILTGMETHICVYLTALGLIREGFAVFVPCDAVLARGREHHESGLSLIDKAGGVVTNSETLLFQMMGCSGGETFKAVSASLKNFN